MVSKKSPSTKVLDEEIVLGRPRRGAKLREEVWEDRDGTVVKYNLAYINHIVCRVDNGRVLGYDSQHGSHHRHYLGTVTGVAFESFEKIESLFESELRQLLKGGAL